MPTARELAEAVQELFVANDQMIAGIVLECRRKVDVMLADILDAPQPQASATVARMRGRADSLALWANWPVDIREWANELETAERRIVELKAQVKALQPTNEELQRWP